MTRDSTKAPRLVSKNGICLVRQNRPQQHKWKELRNLFLTFVDCKWRWICLILVCGFLASWGVFGLIYYLICYIHGDLSPQALEDGWKPCVQNLDSLLSAIFFSMESQHTIGYGYRYITTQCPVTSVFLAIQCMVGSVLQAILIGIVLAKLLRPKKRRQEIIFSQKAVITREDGNLCLQYRISDIGDLHLVEAHIRLYLVRKHVTSEGEVQHMKQFDMNVGYDSGFDRILLMWPMIVCHVIDEKSPLAGITEKKLEKHVTKADFELIATIEGIVESTGMTTQAKTSYLPQEILWDHRFANIVVVDKKGFQGISNEEFDKTYPVNSKFMQIRSSRSSSIEDYATTNTTETVLSYPLEEVKQTTPDQIIME